MIAFDKVLDEEELSESETEVERDGQEDKEAELEHEDSVQFSLIILFLDIFF